MLQFRDLQTLSTSLLSSAHHQINAGESTSHTYIMTLLLHNCFNTS